MRALGAFTALAAATLAAQPDAGLRPELLLLARIKTKMAEVLARQTNYTCLETIERSLRRAPARKFELVDVVRLEVALVGGKELFAWPGAKKFEDSELREMVSNGAIGNGTFALHARGIFETSAPQFTWRGAWDIDGRRVVRYDFRVPLISSGYTLRVGDRRAIVGYHGSFWAEPDALDLARLEVIADDIPPRLGLADARDRMDYARVKIGESQFLLPASSELIMTDLDGTEHRNRTRFAACRQYSGESVLSFADPPPAAPAPAAAAPVEITLPGDLELIMALEEEIDTDRAAVGDPVRARLECNVKRKGQVLVPKGAAVEGRISHLERHQGYLVVGLQFSSIEFANSRARFQAAFERATFSLNSRRENFAGVVPRPGEAILTLRGARVRLARGFVLHWRTQS